MTSQGTRRATVALWPLGAAVSFSVTAAMIGLVARQVAHDRLAPWIIGRAGGVLAYGLLVLLVLSGLLLAHPWRTRYRWLSAPTRIRLHALLAGLAVTFTVLHIVVLATDRYAGVGWSGVLLPLGASYRPVAVTLGVVGLWAGLLAGITAALAGRIPRWVWWPLHKIAAVSVVLCWLHGVYAGTDRAVLHWLYLPSAVMLLTVALSRYLARTPRDVLEERLARS